MIITIYLMVGLVFSSVVGYAYLMEKDKEEIVFPREVVAASLVGAVFTWPIVIVGALIIVYYHYK